MAKTLLLQGTQTVTFAGGSASVAEVFFRFVEALPPVVRFGEVAPAGDEEQPLSAEQEAFLRKYWGDLPVEQVARYMSQGRRR
jgi:hypothetical protein